MHRDAGYTMIEMMVSLVILASVFLMIISGIGTTRRVWERSDAKAASIDAVVGAETLLRTKLTNAFPQTKFDASAPYVDFIGANDKAQFLSYASGGEGRQALRRFALFVDDQNNLVLSSISDVAAKTVAPNNLVLMKGVESVSIAYYGPLANGTGTGWQPTWESRPRLPDLIRVQVEYPQDDQRVWPELIVHPSATTDSLCVLDTRMAKCRGRV
jgi:general secretion pathway protein J